MRKHHKNQSSNGSRLSNTAFAFHASAQTIAPATASRMKWFAVAIIAMRIIAGYKKPIVTAKIRRVPGIVILRLPARKEEPFDLCGASGIVVIVKPTSKL